MYVLLIVLNKIVKCMPCVIGRLPKLPLHNKSAFYYTLESTFKEKGTLL